MITLTVFEDNNHYRESLKHLFNFIHDIELVCASTDCDNLRNTIKQYLPDVVLMDIDMPGMNGLEATSIVKELSPKSQVIMLTVSESEERIFEALSNGATGYLLKKSSSIELIDAVRSVHEGGSPMSPAIARKVLQYFNSNKNIPKTENNTNEELPKPLENQYIQLESQTKPFENQCLPKMPTETTENDATLNLTPREFEILEGLVDGLSYKMIAGNLFISPETVKNHIQGVYRKLQVNSKGEAISKAIKEKIVK
jgi:DNA-binding NarL/FixJ family response regulator